MINDVVYSEENLGTVTSAVNTPGLQPHGGFLSPDEMAIESISKEEDYEKKNSILNNLGNISSTSLGLVFDYLFRLEYYLDRGKPFMDAANNAFSIAYKGAMLSGRYYDLNELFEKLKTYYERRDKNFRNILYTSCKIVNYDTIIRCGIFNSFFRPPTMTTADAELMNRMLHATKEYLKNKNELKFGMEFLAKDFKRIMRSDCDLIADDSLIDFKCLSKKITSKHTLQLIMYYILGIYEEPEIFRNIKYLKIINPKLGLVYSYEISKIDYLKLSLIEEEIMGGTRDLFQSFPFDNNKKIPSE